MVISVTLDPSSGRWLCLVLVGVEILKDVSFRIVPLTEEDAYEMIYDIRGVPTGRCKRPSR